MDNLGNKHTEITIEEIDRKIGDIKKRVDILEETTDKLIYDVAFVITIFLIMITIIICALISIK